MQPPAEVAAALNRILLEEVATDHYCTLAYAEIDLSTGALRLVQAGHPHPVIQRACGAVEFLGDGGLPVGLFPGATYAGVEAVLRPGDRLLIMSDGVTECADASGREFGETGLAPTLLGLMGRRGHGFLDGLLTALGTHSETEDFADDVSAVLLEFDGQTGDEGPAEAPPRDRGAASG